MDDSEFSPLVFFVGNYFVTFFIIGLIAAGISLLNKPKPLRIGQVSEAFLSYHLLFAIGINNLINFVFHVFLGDVAAKFIGWENSPFQAEVGFASLGVGIAGVIAFKASLPFRFATLIPPWAFSLGAAGGHIYQMIVAHNFSPGNVGLVLPIDILMPIVGFVFLWLSYKHPQPGTAKSQIDLAAEGKRSACPTTFFERAMRFGIALKVEHATKSVLGHLGTCRSAAKESAGNRETHR